jgi:hypothetical protein
MAPALLLAAEGLAAARVVEVPEGGRAVPVAARDGVVCGSLPAGWVLAADRRSVRPPAPDSQAARSIEVKVAADADACDRRAEAVTVIAVGRFPEIDPAGVVFAPDEGRLELRGADLKGVQVSWRAPGRDGKEVREGKDSCLEPAPLPNSKLQHCVVPLQPGLPFGTALGWLPARAVVGEEVRLFDAKGDAVSPAQLELRPSRVLISQVVPSSAAVDVSLGVGRVPLSHPPAVVAVDCGIARCELGDGAILVRSVPAPATQIALRLRLAPRVFFLKGDAQESQVNLTLPLVQCPLGLASGPPLRDADESFIVVKVDPRCAKEGGRARWSVNSEAVEESRVVPVNDAAYVVLRAGRLLGERAVVTARRADLDATIIGSLTARTVPAPRPRVSLELPKHGKVEFIPTNRDAVLTVASPGDRAHLVPLSVEGAYTVRQQGGQFLVRADENAGGFVALRFGYRVEGLPPELGPLDLAVLSERVQRAVRQASVPAPFSTTAESPEPLAELICADRHGNPERVMPGRLHRLAFDAKDTCRVVLHRERLKPEYGVQEILLEVEVTKSDGSRRGEVSFSQSLTLVPGAETRVIPLRGGNGEFDRMLVRLSHVLDESRYALSAQTRQGLPSVQWPLAVEGGRLRLYATAAIPAGLYRINKPTGQLTLNFGVLSRLTWLDDRGREGLFGAEVGLMGMGLIQRPSAVDFPPTLGAVAGLGLRVPLGGGAAVGVHVWAAYEFRDSFKYKVDPDAKGDCTMAECRFAPRISFIFGPSISIGDVGTNL